MLGRAILATRPALPVVSRPGNTALKGEPMSKWINLPLPLPEGEGHVRGQHPAACELAPEGETPPDSVAEGMAEGEGMADVQPALSDVGQWAAGQIAMIGVSARARAMMQRRADRAAARAEEKAAKKRRRAGGI